MSLRGYRLIPVEITDPDVVRVSGQKVHMIAVASGNPDDRISGVVTCSTKPSWPRPTPMKPTLMRGSSDHSKSGRSAWVYVLA